MRAIWKGAISFGLVNIPIALYSAVKKEEVRFRMLRKSDLSPVLYRRVAETDGVEVPWEQVGKGYEYEKGRFILLSDEDFQRVDLNSAQTINIVDFVSLREIDPILFDKPYYLEPQKGGAKAYALLRQVLQETGKVGIAKVVIKTRQYLAAVKSEGEILVLQLMHFADEIMPPDGLNVARDEQVSKRELDMAKTLVESMSDKWQPERYTDDYRNALLTMIEERIQQGEKAAPKKAAKAPAGKVLDLVDILQQSLAQTEKKKKARSKAA